MLLIALVKLGFSEREVIHNVIESLDTLSLPDDGFLCLPRMNKLKCIPKSCYKVHLHALMFLAECHKNNININLEQALIDFF